MPKLHPTKSLSQKIDSQSTMVYEIMLKKHGHGRIVTIDIEH